MEIDIEGRIWQKACERFGARMQVSLEEALRSFKRQPGLDEPTRIHASQISPFGLQVLGDAMAACHGDVNAPGDTGYLPIATQSAFEAPSSMAIDAGAGVGRRIERGLFGHGSWAVDAVLIATDDFGSRYVIYYDEV